MPFNVSYSNSHDDFTTVHHSGLPGSRQCQCQCQLPSCTSSPIHRTQTRQQLFQPSLASRVEHTSYSPPGFSHSTVQSSFGPPSLYQPEGDRFLPTHCTYIGNDQHQLPIHLRDVSIPELGHGSPNGSPLSSSPGLGRCSPSARSIPSPDAGYPQNLEETNNIECAYLYGGAVGSNPEPISLEPYSTLIDMFSSGDSGSPLEAETLDENSKSAYQDHSVPSVRYADTSYGSDGFRFEGLNHPLASEHLTLYPFAPSLGLVNWTIDQHIDSEVGTNSDERSCLDLTASCNYLNAEPTNSSSPALSNGYGNQDSSNKGTHRDRHSPTMALELSPPMTDGISSPDTLFTQSMTSTPIAASTSTSPTESLPAFTDIFVESPINATSSAEPGAQAPIRTLSCPFTGCPSRVLFTRACDVNKHYRQHFKRFFCRIEGCHMSEKPAGMGRSHGAAGFATKKDRLRHENSHDPSIICGICGKAFSRADNLQDHKKRIHRKGNRLYQS
ncbi:hypothetical protein EJ07DRAFT_153935 [Lizonia empirigonia]|nr:hypothetical protein EJ07DRAFT_153935 [Lizonia empirigonia]